MSEATKRKIVTHEVVHGEVSLSKGQYIVKVCFLILLITKSQVIVC